MLEFDQVGYWSQIKLDIVQKYALAYSTFMAAQRNPSYEHVYIDAFAGAGVHIPKGTRRFIPGSPLNALLITPRFHRYYFIDIKAEKTQHLRELSAEDPRVLIHQGDCNEVLNAKVFPNVQWNQYRRGLCILDPYGLHLDWSVIEAAGKLKTLEIFLSFPVADMGRPVLWRNPVGVDSADIKRLTQFWGDGSWKDVAYDSKPDSSGRSTKTDHDTLASAFQARLQNVAKFRHVPEPLPMRNSKGSVIYYLFFASQKPVAGEIVTEIFDTYRQRGGAGR